MRGTLMFNRGNDRTPGIIPAYAGNTFLSLIRRHLSRDHPRVCGEHSKPMVEEACKQGSSPRMRGTHGACCPASPRSGIIPAYAGNTMALQCRERPGRDHPRVCGEHLPVIRSVGARGGSSPRMRGTPEGRAFDGGERGIIPAYAGNTTYHCGQTVSARDHPRVCGEHKSVGRVFDPITGSSPRMRGTPV